MVRWGVPAEGLTGTVVELRSGRKARISTGDTTTETPVAKVGVESTDDGTAWRVHNYTGQTLTAGDFHRDQGANVGSALTFGGTTPWSALEPGKVTGCAFQFVALFNFKDMHTWGKVAWARSGTCRDW